MATAAAFDKKRGITMGPGGSITIAKGKTRLELGPREIGDLLEVLLLALPPGPKRDYAVLHRQHRALVEGALAAAHKSLDAVSALSSAVRELETDAKTQGATSRARSCVSLGAMAATRQAELLAGVVALMDHGLLLPAAEEASTACPQPPPSTARLTRESTESARATLPPPPDGENVCAVVGAAPTSSKVG